MLSIIVVSTRQKRFPSCTTILFEEAFETIFNRNWVYDHMIDVKREIMYDGVRGGDGGREGYIPHA